MRSVSLNVIPQAPHLPHPHASLLTALELFKDLVNSIVLAKSSPTESEHPQRDLGLREEALIPRDCSAVIQDLGWGLALRLAVPCAETGFTEPESICREASGLVGCRGQGPSEMDPPPQHFNYILTFYIMAFSHRLSFGKKRSMVPNKKAETAWARSGSEELEMLFNKHMARSPLPGRQGGVEPDRAAPLPSTLHATPGTDLGQPEPHLPRAGLARRPLWAGLGSGQEGRLYPISPCHTRKPGSPVPMGSPTSGSSDYRRKTNSGDKRGSILSPRSPAQPEGLLEIPSPQI